MEEFRCEPSTLFDTSILNPCSIPLTEMEFVAHYKDLQGIMADEYPTMNVMMNYVNPDGGPSKIYAGLDYSDALTNSVSIGFGIGDNGSLGSDHAGKKRKIMLAPESSSDVSSDENSANKNNFGKGKTGKHKQQKVSGSGGEREKPKEVIHVRARRGQATDSHSLAERVRREKINERMRCLQELVPGCYKTMGMAVMLEEIINYVQSLQNQVEFLSMKLSAATSSYDFHTNVVAQEMHQGRIGWDLQEQMVRSDEFGSHLKFHTN